MSGTYTIIALSMGLVYSSYQECYGIAKPLNIFSTYYVEEDVDWK
jgi:hypothetical protein